MSGGTISGNTSNDNGGGVFVYSGTFSMEGGTISSNQATNNSNGGGVYLNEGALFTMMSGGTISGNTSSYEGGGVFVSAASTFSMKGGTISSNQAAEGGGGVFVDGNSTFTKEAAGGSSTSGVIYGSDEDSLLANAAKSASHGHAVKYAGGGGLKRNSTAGPDVPMTTKVPNEPGGWDPKPQP
jgi:hypothetical protein